MAAAEPKVRGASRFERKERGVPSNLPIDCETEVQQMFDASIEVKVGNAELTYFWTDRWFNGRSI